MNTDELKESKEKAQIIIDTAVNRIRELGFGVVADGTVYGNGVWINSLRVRFVGGAQQEPKDQL